MFTKIYKWVFRIFLFLLDFNLFAKVKITLVSSDSQKPGLLRAHTLLPHLFTVLLHSLLLQVVL